MHIYLSLISQVTKSNIHHLVKCKLLFYSPFLTLFYSIYPVVKLSWEIMPLHSFPCSYFMKTILFGIIFIIWSYHNLKKIEYIHTSIIFLSSPKWDCFIVEGFLWHILQVILYYCRTVVFSASHCFLCCFLKWNIFMTECSLNRSPHSHVYCIYTL